MTPKSLLVASAALLAAGQAAQAADAVVTAEPEPMEYVRICDAYGEGFYYIPGTETCLKIGGYVRAQIDGGDLFDDPDDSWNTLLRFALRTDTRTETELGTLRSATETRFIYRDGEFNTTELNYGYIEIAGFLVGKNETAFDTFSGYAGNVANDDIVPFGPYDTMLAQYTAEFGGGFSGLVSVEEGSNEFAAGEFPDEIEPAIDGDELITYVPHVVVGLKYESTFFDINGVAAYDANNEEFAGKVRVDIKPSETFYGFVMGGYKTDDGQREERGLGLSDGTNWYGIWGDNGRLRDDDGSLIVDDDGRAQDTADDAFAVWAGLSYVFNPEMTFNSQVSYDEDENFAAVAQVNFEPVEGLSIQPEVVYFNDFDGENGVESDDDELWGGTLRLQRDF